MNIKKTENRKLLNRKYQSVSLVELTIKEKQQATSELRLSLKSQEISDIIYEQSVIKIVCMYSLFVLVDRYSS